MGARCGTGDDDSDRSASASQTNADGSSRDGLDSSLYGTAIGEEPASGPALESSLTATTELGSVDGTRKMRKTDIVTNENNVDSLGRAMTFLEKELELLCFPGFPGFLGFRSFANCLATYCEAMINFSPLNRSASAR